MDRKEEIFFKILNAAVALDFRKWHLRWSMAELSRESKITRSLIYYYFSKEKESILEEAVKLIGSDFFGLVPTKDSEWTAKRFGQSLLKTRHNLKKSPHLVTFYLAQRDKDTPIGIMLRDLETQYIKKLKKAFPNSKEKYLQGLYAVFFGLAFAPMLEDDALLTAVELAVQSLVKFTGARSPS